MPERTIDFTITPHAPSPAGDIPAGEEAISFSYGIAAGQDSELVVHHAQAGRAMVALAPYGLAVTLTGYMAHLPGWISLRVVHTPNRGYPFPAHESYDYPTLVNALRRAGFRETINPTMG
ncbi:hypothetical protein [Microbacterium lacticum]|uniref:hypothetical protein n=1 Tax=Microbacterium lacticum TaxID=33885 RepID=UPI001F57EA73|nr:hypothetical protein [Microbacterium lacticum]